MATTTAIDDTFLAARQSEIARAEESKATEKEDSRARERKRLSTQQAFDRYLDTSAERSRRAQVTADERLAQDIAQARRDGDTARAEDLATRLEGLRIYVAQSRTEASQALNTQRTRQNAASQAAIESRDILLRAEQALNAQIQAARKRGDATAAEDLKEKQAQIRADIDLQQQRRTDRAQTTTERADLDAQDRSRLLDKQATRREDVRRASDAAGEALPGPFRE